MVAATKPRLNTHTNYTVWYAEAYFDALSCLVPYNYSCRISCERFFIDSTTKNKRIPTSLRGTPRRSRLTSVGLPHVISQSPDPRSADHCIEILRQVLMCNADTGIITYEWVDGSHDPHPNFNTMHRCRNFDKLQSWNLGHSSMSHVMRFADTVDLSGAP